MLKDLNRTVWGLRHCKRIGELTNCICLTNQWPRLIPAYVLRAELSYPFEFTTRDNGKVVLDDWDDLTTAWHVFFANEYLVPRSSRSIVDLGANYGAFTIWAAHRCPGSRIVSVEPFPATFRRLISNVIANELDAQVDCLQLAVSGYDGVGSFESKPTKRSYCRKLADAGAKVETIEVDCITLASLLDRVGFDEIDCLKMDVEGAEYDIILSASPDTLRRAKTITLEYHEGDKAALLWNKLAESGFRRVLYSPGGWSGLAAYERSI